MKGLYETDFSLWAEQNATLLKEGRFSEADMEHITEEIEALSGSEKNTIDSATTQLIAHLLKWQYQSDKRSRSWQVSITKQRVKLFRSFRRSPSLRRYFSEALEQNHRDALLLAAAETGCPASAFPQHCRYSMEQLLDEKYLPE